METAGLTSPVEVVLASPAVRRALLLGAVAFAIALGLLFGLTGHGGHPAPSQTVGGFLGPGTACDVFLGGSNLEVVLSGGDRSCRDWIRAQSSATAFWTENDPSPHDSFDARHQVCLVAKDNATITVLDSGGADYGDRLCGSLVARGWREN